MRVGVSASLALERAARGRRSFLVLRFGERSYAAHCCLGKGFCGALSSYVSVLLSRRVLAPLVPDAAAMWQPPAAKEGQGDCEFPLLPPWILFSPLCTAAAPLRGWRRRSSAFLRGALPCCKGFVCRFAFFRRAAATFCWTHAKSPRRLCRLGDLQWRGASAPPPSDHLSQPSRRCTASVTLSRSPKAVSLNQPSPCVPKPAPGVPTIWHSFSSSS